MRPNIDMPWSLHGQVKEVADKQDLTVEEAYKRVVRRGLSTEVTAVQNIIEQVEANLTFRSRYAPSLQRRTGRLRRRRRRVRGGDYADD